MPRQGPRRLPAGERDRSLAEEVLYLHSLWRRGGPAPAPAPPQSRSDGREERERIKLNRALRRVERKRLRLERQRKRRKIGRAAAAEPALAPSPPTSSPGTLAEAAAAAACTIPSTANPPPPTTPPGWVAQREGVRASVGPESDGEKEEEERAMGYFTWRFQKDAGMRGYYTRRWHKGWFHCLVCAKGRKTKVRAFRGCFALLQHASDAARSRIGSRGAHRALAAVVCRLLGWDIKTLAKSGIVIDPPAAAGVQHAKENDGTAENNGYSTDDDSYSIDEDEESEDEESVDEEDDIETGTPDSSADGDEEDSGIESNEEYAEKEDADTGAEGSKITDGDKEAIELHNSEKIPEKEAANSNARKWDIMKIREHLLWLTHAKPVDTTLKKMEVQKRSRVPKHKEVSTSGSKFNESSNKTKRKASALVYQDQSSTSGVVKKVKVNQQLTNKGKQIKTNETGASARKAKRPAVAARKARQQAMKLSKGGN